MQSWNPRMAEESTPLFCGYLNIKLTTADVMTLRNILSQYLLQLSLCGLLCAAATEERGSCLLQDAMEKETASQTVMVPPLY